MMSGAPCFSKPSGNRIALQVQPRLASWMAAGHPDQIRLEQFLTHAEDATRERLHSCADPIGLRLDVGLPAATPLLAHHDLDNYAFPLVTRLASRSARRFASVWVTKQHAADSFLTVATTTPGTVPAHANRFSVRTTASAQSPAYKEQIHAALADATELPDGAVALQLSFTTGPQRQWPNLWKQTIDALGSLLGRSAPHVPWHPRDGRITELAMHSRVDPGLGYNVEIDIAASSVEDLP